LPNKVEEVTGKRPNTISLQMTDANENRIAPHPLTTAPRNEWKIFVLIKRKKKYLGVFDLERTASRVDIRSV
jgi:hypothetical protein